MSPQLSFDLSNYFYLLLVLNMLFCQCSLSTQINLLARIYLIRKQFTLQEIHNF